MCPSQPAKGPATDHGPDATRARPWLELRGQQMVLQLLADNGEARLAERFNACLADADEYRSILRDLRHQGGSVDCTKAAITVTLDRPPRRQRPRPDRRLTQCRRRPPTR